MYIVMSSLPPPPTSIEYSWSKRKPQFPIPVSKCGPQNDGFQKWRLPGLDGDTYMSFNDAKQTQSQAESGEV